MRTIGLIITIIKSIPGAVRLWNSLIDMYKKWEADRILKRDKEAMEKAINESDQRDLEKQIGSTISGQPSNIPGTTIVDDLPNVVQGTVEKRD